MTRIEAGKIVIEPEPPERCSDCGEIAETRPYGPDGARICHPCGLKDPEGTRRRMRMYMGLPRD